MVKENFISRASIWFVLASLVSSCASYRVVRVVQVTDQEAGQSQAFYGVTKNNVLIPEFTLDERNRYPATKIEAWQRFEASREKIESFVDKKYKIPNSFLFQTERIIVGIGLILVSPVAIPLQYAAGMERDEDGKRNFARTVTNYFDLSLNNVVTDDAAVRDPLAAVSP